MSDTRKILCSACGKPADAIIHPDRDTRIRCPDCGREADLKEAMAAAAKYHVSKLISGSLGNVRSKHVTIKRSPNPRPDFVLEEDHDDIS